MTIIKIENTEGGFLCSGYSTQPIKLNIHCGVVYFLLAIATMYVRNQSFEQQCSFEMCNTHTGVLLREWTHTTQCSLFMRKSEKQSMRGCLVVICNLLYVYYLHNNTGSRRTTTTVRSNDTLVDTPFQLISGLWFVL